MRGIVLAAVLFAVRCFAADPVTHPPLLQPDDRYKADILVVVAHPDDETMVSGYLARAIYDQHKRVAVVFGTRGDGGGNAAGNEQAAALGAEREIEGRRALAALGIFNVWFLGGPDTPGQDVLRSLETWNHGDCLGRLVRIYRLTRPEVVLTWLPAYVAGENHGDHQAAGVLAAEAFDLSGDRTQFAEQVTAPRDHYDIGNLTEGLLPWQPKKIYFFSDASHTDFLEGKGPVYSTVDVSPARKMPYYRIAADEMAYHLTQSDTGMMAVRAIEKNDFSYFRQPVRLIFGKSVTASVSPTADVFSGITAAPPPFVRPAAYKASDAQGTGIRLGGPWAFYRDFQPAHGLEHLSQLLASPETAAGPGSRLHIPILIGNSSGSGVEITLSANAPAGWRRLRGEGRYPVRAHETYPASLEFEIPADAAAGWREVRIDAKDVGGAAIGSVALRVHIERGALPQ